MHRRFAGIVLPLALSFTVFCGTGDAETAPPPGTATCAAAPATVGCSPTPPSSNGIPHGRAGIDRAFQLAQQAGAHLDASVAALGNPVNPSEQDVERDFARLHWPAGNLPQPSALADPVTREWLAIANSPMTTVATSTVDVGDAAPQAITAAPRGPRARAAASGTAYRCSISMTSTPYSSGASVATTLFTCPVAVFWNDSFEWYSDYTGSLIDGPYYNDNYFGDQVYSSYDSSVTRSGSVRHRSVHWAVTLCGASCGSGYLAIANT